MTPEAQAALVRATNVIPFDPADTGHWFELDVDGAPLLGDPVFYMPSHTMEMPFADIGIVGRLRFGGDAVLPYTVTLKKANERIAARAILLFQESPCVVNMRYEEAHGVWRAHVPEDDVSHLNAGMRESHRRTLISCAHAVYTFFRLLQREQVNAYVPIRNPANAKRIRSGKKPLFAWSTVIIEPPKPHGDRQGGHHASPRQHDRRGHYRTCKNGRRVWVKSCKVGSAVDGIGFHDYRIKNG